jgi:hypothetical protein
VAGWIVTGIGVVGVGVGAGFGLLSIGKRDESRSHCTADTCDATGISLRDDAIRNGNIATGAIIAGSAAIAGGIVLVLTVPRARNVSEPAVTIRATPTATIGGAGFIVQGVFR